MSVKWKEEYATGVDAIDHQHQEFLSHLEALLDAIENEKGQSVLEDLYSFLDSYTRKHFADEESFQQKVNYPHMVLHSEEHKRFINNLEQLHARIAGNGTSGALVKLTRDTLVNWLINHICSMDRELGDFYKVYRNSQWKEWIGSQFQG